MTAGRLLDHLTSRGDDPALLTADRRVSYRELADDVAASASDLGSQRRLVLLECRNDIETLVSYLGALAGGHVVIPLPADGDHAAVIDTYDPDVIVRGGSMEHRHRAAHDLHPDLALLLSTSGSTGSPKLVRLSRNNLIANAESIATYLDIRDTDRAATTLPMSYCYGLSVIHSHLLRGAGLILTDHSVVDDEFWDLMARHRGTTFAGVPHTFDLLHRIGFGDMQLPHLRYVTQAGGRLAPDRVRRFAQLGRRRGWQLFVMYGATEATARMAYLPPELAVDNPHAIGVPIPGGTFDIEVLEGEPVDGMPADVGELVYRGAGVMMGYAHDRDDLAAGRTVAALRTGDLARRNSNGLYEVVGRISRFAKLYGLRLDLERIEASLRDADVSAICTEGDGELLVAAADRPAGCDVGLVATTASGLPRAAVRVLDVDELPRLPTGKPDLHGVRQLADRIRSDDGVALDLRGLFADVLHLDAASIDDGASFVDLGGNSLSYVSMSVRLERAIGHLPADWQRLPLRELEAASRPRRWWGTTLETSVALRAIAIVLVVGSHAGLYTLWGGAHVLLGIAGYNFGRFCLTPLPRLQRARHLRNTIAWIAVPSVAWVAIALLGTNDYTAANLLLANKFLGPSDSVTAGRLWFVEVVVWILVTLALVCWTPIGDRLERRAPFAFAMGFLTLGLVVRFHGFGMGHAAWFTVVAFWFFAIGWAASKASTTLQRLAVTLMLAVGIVGYFGNPRRELLVFVGLALLIWLPAVRCPSIVTVTAGVLAEASLVIYLTHYQVYPLFGEHRLLGVTSTLLTGVVLTQLLMMARRRIRVRGIRHVNSRTASPAPR
ncbi:AMP-binding protein [Mycolicibacterium hodleri]|uniref:AMP-dependent synthetase n=1 Tax=Mycolicibacterium hodleri TaxID=49897 RepID=A0A502EK47_9MYCO|nr:AMP-binding protein [Mycolicibacterium hodleri]TPG36890.1 AMP-dependent synthetase [Mycolicibacterium hodleri]